MRMMNFSEELQRQNCFSVIMMKVEADANQTSFVKQIKDFHVCMTHYVFINYCIVSKTCRSA